jgi:DNA-binding beta-propeller fold protein YncE
MFLKSHQVNKASVRFLLLLLGWLFSISQISADPVKTHNIKFIRDITGAAAGPLSLPSDVAVNKQHVYIVDGGNHRVVVFDHEGKYLFAIGGKGESAGQFHSPVGIDVGEDGRIYVADKDNHRIQIFSKDGKYLNSFQIKSKGTLVRPIDVAVGPEGKEIYVTGNNNHKVMVLSEDGQLKREWGGSGQNSGEFRYPGTIAFLQDARLAVVDILNTRIQIFEQSGEFSIEVGEWGVLPGQLFRPKGVAVDSKGYLYVSDSYMNLIQVFSDTGRFVHLLKISEITRTMETPAGIAISNDQRLYVAEMLQNKVSVFGLGP